MKLIPTIGAETIFLPVIIHPGDFNEPFQPLLLTNAYPGVIISDIFVLQKRELLKCLHPSRNLSTSDIDALYKEWLQSHNPLQEGVWVYYPWLNKVIHILNKEEFIALRTNRNFYKITPDEQNSLATKTVGIIGLSVGHAVALTMATERICGKMKLADFDCIELSNLNRIKTGIQNIGLNKCVVTAREIAEIDPFIEIECYQEGLTENNIETFLLENGKLDILVDECDGIDMKILCRQKAKQHKIPVVMETSDRGMLDVERFDLDENRDLLHGLLEGIPLNNLKNLSNEEKIPLILKIADVKKGSLRGKVSMLEVGQSISTWPQLASAVTLGGAVVTDVCRRILLNQYSDSGRYYIDLEELAGNKKTGSEIFNDLNPFIPFNATQAILNFPNGLTAAYVPDESMMEEIVNAACHAPSTGNDQPWKWIYKNGILYLFHDEHRSFSFGDYDNLASYISFGAAFENILLKSGELGLSTNLSFYSNDPSNLVAAIRFNKNQPDMHTEKIYDPNLAKFIYSRSTNRNPSEPAVLSTTVYNSLTAAAKSIENARVIWITEKTQLLEIGKIIGECDRIRLLNARGHYDFANREMRWTKEDAISTKDGIDIRTLGLSGPLIAALSIIKDPAIAASLKKINGGKALVEAAVKTVMTGSAIGMIILPEYNKENFFRGGMAVQRLWLQAEASGLAIHPLISPFYLFPRITKGEGIGLDNLEIEKLTELRKRFLNIVPISGKEAEVFLFKIAQAAKPSVSTLRLPLHETLTVIKD